MAKCKTNLYANAPVENALCVSTGGVLRCARINYNQITSCERAAARHNARELFSADRPFCCCTII